MSRKRSKKPQPRKSLHTRVHVVETELIELKTEVGEVKDEQRRQAEAQVATNTKLDLILQGQEDAAEAAKRKFDARVRLAAGALSVVSAALGIIATLIAGGCS